eukprot:TRINITY_DN11679_c0_g1_i1.p1 TRINITY_DN11679_c0_g1~~TRINITY_DN11679_c0_g1_i1.p1  ORF type:complete len:1132 (+),score=214.35 TRINITY_DN11679_c0_g1_i1:14-3409(+)
MSILLLSFSMGEIVALFHWSNFPFISTACFLIFAIVFSLIFTTERNEQQQLQDQQQQPLLQPADRNAASTAETVAANSNSTPQQLSVNDTSGGGGSGTAAVASPPSFNFIMKRRCCWGYLLRWQCALLIFFIASIVVLLFEFVVMREVIKSCMKKANLEFQSIVIKNPNDDSFDMQATGRISDYGQFGARIATSQMQLLYDNKMIGLVNLDAMSLSGSSEMISLSTHIKISDMSAFNSFGRSFILNHTVHWALSGKVDVTPLIWGLEGMEYKNIDFQHSLVSAGCDGLQNVTIGTFSMKHSTADTIFIDLDTVIQNPSVLGLVSAGNLTMDILYNDVFMGSIVSADLTLLPGENTIHMHGFVKPENESIANELIEHYLSNEPTPLLARTRNHPLPFDLFDGALGNITLQTTLEGNKELLVKAATFESITMTPINSEAIRLSTLAHIEIMNPLGDNSPITFDAISMTIETWYHDQLVGSMNTPLISPTCVGGEGNNITLNITDVLLAFAHDQGQAFIDFSKEYIDTKGLVQIEVKGVSYVEAHCAIGPLVIHHMPVTCPLFVQGFGGFDNVRMENFDIPGEVMEPTPAAILVTNSSFINPTVTTVFIPESVFDMSVDGARFGRVTCYNLTVYPGQNYVSSYGTITVLPHDLEALGRVASSYINGQDQSLEIRGVGAGAYSSSFPWLSPVIQHLHFLSVFKGALNLSLTTWVDIHSIELGFDAEGEHTSATATMSVGSYVPWNIHITILRTAMNMTLNDDDHNDTVIAGAYVPIENNLIVYNQSSSSFEMEIKKTPLPVYVADYFGNFLSSLISGANGVLHVKGYATECYVDTILGILPLNTHIDQMVYVPGLNSFRDPYLELQNIDMLDGATARGEIPLSINITYSNISPLYITLGRLTLDLLYENVTVGNATLTPFKLDLGLNSFYNVLGSFVMPHNSPAGIHFISRFISGLNSTLGMKGGEGDRGTNDKIMQKAIGQFHTTTEVQGLVGAKSPVNQVHIHLTLTEIFNLFIGKSKDLPSKAVMTNPFSSALYVMATNITVRLMDAELVAFWIEDRHSHPLILPPHRTITSELLPIKIHSFWDKSLWSAFMTAVLTGKIDLDMTGTLTIKMSEYEFVCPVTFENVVTDLKG